MEHRAESDICVIYAEGQITHATVDAIKLEIEYLLLQDTYRGVVINCKSSEHLDSSGLGFVVFLDRLTRKNGIKLVFCEMQGRLYDLFLMSGLHTKIEIFPTETLALQSFS